LDKFNSYSKRTKLTGLYNGLSEALHKIFAKNIMNSDINSLDIINYISMAFYLVFGLICIASSIIVLYICLAKCNRKATEIILICIFCVSEIISSIDIFIFAIYKLVFGYRANQVETEICKFNAFALMISIRISIINVSILAILRYLIVYRSKELKLSTWLIIILIPNAGVTIFYSLGFYTKDAAPSSSYLYCIFFTKSSGLSAAMFYFIPFLYIIPCWVTTYCYFIVGWIANNRLNLMKQEATNNSDEALLASIKKEKFKLWMQLLFVFCIYNGNFVLSYTTWVMKLAINYKRTVVMDSVVTLQTTSTAYLNPLVNIIFQPDINHEFKFIWNKLKRRVVKMFK
jgi:hypothetical protein